ncbi:hypothetical protein [Streptomyces sp. NPDC056169]|uniref:hypothetical protein n=1 Tax=Streptomyces sp. NPDC056169 TaxID=3345734 RepID=UPI0035D8E70F
MGSLGGAVSYEDCTIYVDASDGSTVLARLRRVLGPGDEGGVLVVGPVRVTGDDNGYVTGDKAHPFDFLQWPTVLECEAPAEARPGAVVDAVALVLEALWEMGFTALAACDFEDELPASGGRDRYPLPPVSAGPPPRRGAGRRWRPLRLPRFRPGGDDRSGRFG